MDVIAHVQALVKCGALTLTSAGETVEALIEQGITALIPSGVREYEDQWGEYCRVHVSGESIGFHVDSHPHAWIMRLKPIMLRLTEAEGAAFITALNVSIVQGPFMWEQIIDVGPQSDTDAPPDADEAQSWLTTLFTNHPALKEIAPEGDQLTLAPVVGAALSDDGLRALLASFVAASAAAASAAVVGECALMVTSWDKDCYVDHGHDRHDAAISNGDWDAPDGSPFDGSCPTIEEFSRKINLVGEFIAAATALEEWTNAHC